MKYLSFFAGLLAVCALLVSSYASAEGEGSSPQSAHAFVQGFYDWYVQQSQQDNNLSGVELALKDRPEAFSEEIVRALREDLAASAKSPDEVVGLDFDPFLNAQEVCAPYKVGKTAKQGNTYRVEVYGSCPDAGSHKPDVIAEMRARDGRWMFVNFIYPGNGDLLTVLKSLKEERQKN
ncbi:MAG TPA: hypothetical protein VGT99_12145 [Gammaproteobacteria bacterium]|nr:hypothetical protein [Gammaproteobacteria bacterium]